MNDRREAKIKPKGKAPVVAPTTLAVPLILNAKKIGAIASDAVLLGAKKFGTAGTGAKISGLTGFYADRAARSTIGGGTKRLGGKGIAGGNAKLELVAKLTVGVVIVAAGTVHVTNQYRAHSRQREGYAREAVPCENCAAPRGGLLPEPQAAVSCSICGHVATSD